MDSLEQAVEDAVEKLRDAVSETKGSEVDVLTAFSEAVGSEVAGWDMRISELQMEDEDPDMEFED